MTGLHGRHEPLHSSGDRNIRLIVTDKKRTMTNATVPNEEGISNVINDDDVLSIQVRQDQQVRLRMALEPR